MTKKSSAPAIRFKGFTDLPAGQAGGRQTLGKWCAYVLLCDDESLYKGKTNDINRRLKEHLSGNGARHTKLHKPVKLVYIEYFDTEQEALAKEKYFKSGGGREWLKNMMNCAE